MYGASARDFLSEERRSTQESNRDSEEKKKKHVIHPHPVRIKQCMRETKEQERKKGKKSTSVVYWNRVLAKKTQAFSGEQDSDGSVSWKSAKDYEILLSVEISSGDGNEGNISCYHREVMLGIHRTKT